MRGPTPRNLTALLAGFTIVALTVTAVALVRLPDVPAPREHRVVRPKGLDPRLDLLAQREAQDFHQWVTAAAWNEAHEAFAAQARSNAMHARQRKMSADRFHSPPPNASGPSSGVDWDAIAQCETGGDWSHQTQYDGGLGILHAAWLEYGGEQFAPYGSQASREEQIVVAERIYARHGLSGWGCSAYG